MKETPASPRESRPIPVIHWVVMGATLAVLLFFALPLRPSYPWILDLSWQMMLHEAFTRGTQFGTEFVFTYGPWGFTMIPIIYPGTYLWSFLVMGAWAGVFFACAWRMARVRRWNAYWTAGWFLVLAAFATNPPERLAFLALLCAGLLYFHEESCARRNWLAALIGLLAAFATLGKFSFIVLAAAVVGAISLDLILRRRWPWAALTYAAGLPLFWLAAGQRLGNLPIFFARSLDVAAGYSDAMSSWTNHLELPLFLAGSAMLLGCAARAETARSRAMGLIPVLMLAASLFLMFKQGFVRQDTDHTWSYAATLLPLSLVGVALWWRNLAERKFRLLLAATCLAGACSAFLPLYYMWRGVQPAISLPRGQVLNKQGGSGILYRVAKFLERRSTELNERLSFAGSFLTGRASPRRVYEKLLDSFREQFPIPGTAGGCDIYPVEQGVLMANGLTSSARPIFQSYQAYTPVLAALNRDHLLGAQAPETILFRIAAIDGRMPALEDGLSWPELLTRYSPAGRAGPFLVLRAVPNPSRCEWEPLAEIRAQLGQLVSLPGYDEPLWAKLDLKSNLEGAAKNILYKRSPLMVKFLMSDGSAWTGRFILGPARAGFLLSPLITTTEDFLRLYGRPMSRELEAARPTAMVVVPLEGGSDYRSRYRITLYRIRLKNAP
jgi:hypothetical protein